MLSTASWTFPMSCSNENSGVCTPSTTSPRSAYPSDQARTDRGGAAVGGPVGPATPVRQRAQPVDAGVGPELDQDDAAAQQLGGQRLRVEPSGRAVQGRQSPFGAQGPASGHL